ncbi:MAG: pantoate--beta-alanine ligase [Phycisphaerales bacterium]|nr:pantoate--beta-alanine ligase [Phycisphaerales bacterium]
MHVVRHATDLAPFRGGILVPTMGALHAGHAALIKQASSHESAREGVVVSIFVNPAQFNDPRDFEKYPKTWDADLALCEQCGATCIFAPEVGDIYPPGVLQAPLILPNVARGKGLEDHYRPGHFDGVYRVVKRLFDLVQPRTAVFGEKDWQQLQLVRAMVTRERFGIDIIGAPTVRETDGLAASSRNKLLSAEARERALGLSRAIEAARPCHNVAHAERAAWRLMVAHGVSPEYAAVRDGATLGPVQSRDTARVLVAGMVAGTRLIDNGTWA